MAKKQVIMRYTAEEIRSGVVEDKTDSARVYAKTQAEVEADANRGDAENGIVVDWTRGYAGLPQPKAVLNMRVDRDVLEFFKTGGKGYQTKINAVLRAYKEAHSPKQGV